MLNTYSDLKRMSINAADGEIGEVKDALFDDHAWTLRYLVVDTGNWLPGRKVLITPLSVHRTRWVDERLDLTLTREQVKKSPGIDTDKPVSRQHEVGYFDYYGYPYYWSGPFLWGPVAFPATVTAPGAAESLAPEARARHQQQNRDNDPHLRSAHAVSGYRIEAVDGSIGEVTDFLFDDESWSLHYLVVDTGKWLPGRHVLIATDWIGNVSWQDRTVQVAMTRDEVRRSPDYRHDGVSYAQERELHRHHYRRTPPREWDEHRRR